MKKCLILVNFGGPRSLSEIEPFLRALLCDQDVVRTRLPKPLHYLLFSRIAKKRALKVEEDYRMIGGASPIYNGTENLADILRERLPFPLLTFHRYIPKTHALFFEEIQKESFDEILVFPLFPQFSYTTTGSVARFFQKHLQASITCKMRWIKSYPAHPGFVKASQAIIQEFLSAHNLLEEECHFLFTAHGLPQAFIDEGDIYQDECRASFQAISKGFSKATAQLCFQSKFGKGEWLRPYTNDLCEAISLFAKEKKNILFVPLSFTSDHLETLFEIEELYLPIIRKQDLNAFRLPALNLHPKWVEGILSIIQERDFCNTQMLIRN